MGPPRRYITTHNFSTLYCCQYYFHSNISRARHVVITDCGKFKICGICLATYGIIFITTFMIYVISWRKNRLRNNTWLFSAKWFLLRVIFACYSRENYRLTGLWHSGNMQKFRRNVLCLSFTLKMEAARLCETLIKLSQAKRHYITLCCKFLTHPVESIKSSIIIIHTFVTLQVALIFSAVLEINK